MIKFVLSIALMFVAFEIHAQSTYFNKLYGNNSRAEAGYSIITLDSNYIITGGSNGAHSIYPRADLTICLNQKGDTIWTRQDSINNPVCFDIESLNNSLYEIGNVEFPNYQGIYFRKYKPNGDTVWTKYIRIDSADFGEYLIPTHDYGFLIVGAVNTDTNIYANDFNYDKVCLIKFDSNGNVLWVDSLLAHSTGSYADAGIENGDHSFTIVGIYGKDSALVLKIDSNGQLLWYKTYQSGFFDENANCIISTADKGYLVAGSQAEGLVGYEIYYYWLMKLDSIGNTKWQKTYGDSLYTSGFRQIRQTLDRNYAFIGSSQYYNTDTVYANLYKIDTSGNVLFEKEFYRPPYPSSDWNDFAYDVLATPDSGFIFVGSNFDTTSRVWVVKTDKYGCDSVGCQLGTGIEQVENQNSSFSVYPNPAITQTTVLYTVPENTQQVNLRVYDITGRIVEQQVLDKYSHQTTLDVGDFSAGMYLVELKTDEGMVVKKLVVE